MRIMKCVVDGVVWYTIADVGPGSVLLTLVEVEACLAEMEKLA